MKKKILTIGLAAAMLAVVITGGTLAYLTDDEGARNVMTYGNIDIVQHELQRAEGVADNATASKANNDLIPFDQNQKVYPVVPLGSYDGTCSYDSCFTAFGTDNMFWWGDYVTEGGANGLWDSTKLTNVVDKMVFVENTGTYDAWFRTIIAVEAPEDWTVGEIPGGDEIGLNAGGRYNEAVGAPSNEETEIFINGTRYIAYVFYYQSYEESFVKVGETMRPSLLQYALSDKLDNEDMVKFGDEIDVLVLTQAVQKQGFPDAQTACDMAFGDVSAANYVEWLTPVATAQAGPVQSFIE